MSERALRRVAAGTAGAVLAAGVVWPVVALVLRSTRPFAGRAGLSGDVVARVLGEERTWRVVGDTLVQAGWSTLASLAIGVPLAWVLARSPVPGRRALDVLLAVPFVLPSLVVAVGVLEVSDLVGRRGDRPLLLVVVAHAVFDAGLVARVVAPSLAGGAGRAEEAARLLGRSRLRAALGVTLRLAAPTVAGAAVLVFLLAVTSFGVVLALGGTAVTTLEVEVWVRATRLLDLPGAAVLAGLQAVVGLGVLAAVGRVPTTATPGATLPRSAGRARWPGWCAWAVGAAVVGGPLAILVVGSLRRGGQWTVANYADLVGTDLPGGGPSLATTVVRSLAYGGAAAVVAGVAGAATVVSGWRPTAPPGTHMSRASRWLRLLAVLPIGLSAAVLGLGWLVAFGGVIDLRGSAAIVIGAQAVVALPLVVATLGPALERVDRRTWQAATMCGAGPLRRWSGVAWPAVARSAAVAMGFALAAAVGEIGATSFVSSDERATAPIALARLLARPGVANQGRALALGAVLAAACALVVVVADAIGRRSGGGRVGR